jgi:hypothetical protein
MQIPAETEASYIKLLICVRRRYDCCTHCKKLQQGLYSSLFLPDFFFEGLFCNQQKAEK